MIASGLCFPFLPLPSPLPSPSSSSDNYFVRRGRVDMCIERGRGKGEREDPTGRGQCSTTRERALPLDWIGHIELDPRRSNEFTAPFLLLSLWVSTFAELTALLWIRLKVWRNRFVIPRGFSVLWQREYSSIYRASASSVFIDNWQ